MTELDAATTPRNVTSRRPGGKKDRCRWQSASKAFTKKKRGKEGGRPTRNRGSDRRHAITVSKLKGTGAQEVRDVQKKGGLLRPPMGAL